MSVGKLEHLRANHPDDMLIAKAIAAGWEYIEDGPGPWGGNNQYTGWKVTTDDESGLSWCPGKGDLKANYLRGKAQCWPQGPPLGFDHDLICHECGRPIWMAYSNDTEMERTRECFSCHLWLGKIRTPEAGRIIYAGQDGKPMTGVLGNKKTPGRWNGCYGDWFTVTFNDGRVVETCDLWCGGIVPERFRGRLPVNATLRSGRKEKPCEK